MSTRNSGYALQALDKYYTPGWTVSGDLYKAWAPPRACEFWEPCAGAGNLARAIMRSWGQPCLATDIAPDARQLVPVTELDFLKSSGPSTGPKVPLVIITNPPFGSQGRLAERCLAHALEVTEASGGAVLMLLGFAFDAARSRAGLIGNHPAFATKITTSKRIRWTNVAQQRNAPSGDHAWFIWEWQARRRNAWAMKQLQVAA